MIAFIKSIFRLSSSILNQSKGFHCQIDMSDLKLCLWERPGRWMSDEGLLKLQTDILKIAELSHDKVEVPEYGALQPTRENFKNRIITIAYDPKTNEPMAFSAQVYLDLEMNKKTYSLVHLGLAYVSPNYRGRNLTYAINVLPNSILFLKSGMRSFWISSVSQVPAIVGAVEHSFRNVFPHSKGLVQRSYLHSLFAQKIMQSHRQEFGVGKDAWFDEQSHIIKNAYTGGSDNLKKTFSDAPKHRDAAINRMCEQDLDYQRGDDFLQIGLLDMKVFYDLSMRKMHRFGMQVGLQIFFGTLSVVILPVVRWLTPTQCHRDPIIEISQ